MNLRVAGLLAMLAAGATLAAAEGREVRRPAARVWDPYLARYRDEKPGRVWDPYLARYRDETAGRVWDPYLARYRARDPRLDGSDAYDRQADGRHRHPGRDGWCLARH